MMKAFTSLLLLASHAAAVRVVGAAQGFAAGVTGGGSAAEVFPTTNAELASYLKDSTPRVIVLNKTFNFRGTEGTTTATGCAPWGTSASCQTAINLNNWCSSSYPSVSVTYDNAALSPLYVGSSKTLVGVGSTGIIQGKGLYIANGVTNVIIQNIKIEELNPKYVWGGDAIAVNGADLVWIDHVTTYHIGRQHLVFGTGASNRVTVSFHDLDGRSDYSASCNGKHYWAALFTGSADLITFKNNYVHSTSGRSPKITGSTLFHAINNYFYDNPGHNFEVGSGARILAEGNTFQNTVAPIDSSSTESNGYIFTSPDTTTNAQCSTYIGRACVLNGFGSSGAFASVGTVAQALSGFSGKSVPNAGAVADTVSYVTARAGYGKI